MILAGAVLLGVFSRDVWVTASYTDELTGNGAALIRGAQWSTETTAVALLLFVGAIGAFALRRLGRRLIGAVSALAAAGAAVSPFSLLLNGADPERVHALLTAGETPVIPEWAEISDLGVSALNPALTVLGCVIAAVGGVIVALKPGTDAAASSSTMNKYEKESVRRERLAEDLDARPDSGRVMWDALDADIDPTDGPDPKRLT